MEFPNIKLGQYAVLQAELATGIVLGLDGKRRLDSGEAWLVFDSLDEAKTYSNQRVLEFPEIECNIYNHLNEHVLTIDRLKNDPFWDFFNLSALKRIMKRFYLLSILIIAFSLQNTFGQIIPLSVPIVYGEKGDRLPNKMKVRGIVEDVNFWNIGCGIVVWFPAKIKLLNEVKGYPHGYVFVVGAHSSSNKNDIMNKTVEVKLSKLRKIAKPHYSRVFGNQIDSKGVAFYEIDEFKSFN